MVRSSAEVSGSRGSDRTIDRSAPSGSSRHPRSSARRALSSSGRPVKFGAPKPMNGREAPRKELPGHHGRTPIMPAWLVTDLASPTAACDPKGDIREMRFGAFRCIEYQ